MKVLCLTSIRHSVSHVGYVWFWCRTDFGLSGRCLRLTGACCGWCSIRSWWCTGRPAISCGRCTVRRVRCTRSGHTAGRTAVFLSWCEDVGVDWTTISLPDLARFKHWLEATPYRPGRLRSGATVDAVLTAACEFLRFCARTGLIDQAVADRLSEPRWLRFLPPGFDAGERGQFRTVPGPGRSGPGQRHRSLKHLAASSGRRCWVVAGVPGRCSWSV